MIFDSGSFDTTVAGNKDAIINFPFAAGVLYFAASIFGVAAPTVRVPLTSSLEPLFGMGSDLQFAQYGLSIARAFGALPDPFPAGAAYFTSTVNAPLIGFRVA